MSGKGSAPRPFSVSNDEYAARWDAIFGRDSQEPAPPNQEIETDPARIRQAFEADDDGA